jgi:hypothetical protein
MSKTKIDFINLNELKDQKDDLPDVLKLKSDPESESTDKAFG